MAATSTQHTTEYVRLLADYKLENDVIVRRGDLFIVLCQQTDDWVYVTSSNLAMPFHVPTSCVEKLDCTKNTSSLASQRANSMSSNESASSGWAGVIKSVSLRNSTQRPTVSKKTNHDTSDGELDDFPEPPKFILVNTSPNSRDVIETSSSGGDITSVAGQVNDLKPLNDAHGSSFDTSRHRPPQQQQQQLCSANGQGCDDDNAGSLYANWSEIRKMANPTTAVSTTTNAPTKLTPDDVNGQIPTMSQPDIIVISPESTTIMSPSDAFKPRNSAIESPSSTTSDQKPDEVFNASLLNKQGEMQCLQSIDNGKSTMSAHWTSMFVILRGALLSFYRDETSAQPKPDGSIPLPVSSLGLQGAFIQFTRYDYPAYDVIRITTTCRAQFLIHSKEHKETKSWCYHLKNNVAVLLAERTALMESSTPVSTLTAPRGKKFSSTDGSTVGRVAQRLKILLNRRPTKDDLKMRGIYTEPLFGSTLAAVCIQDKSPVPIFLLNCFREIEERGLTISGIYRLSGSISKVQKLRVRVNQGDYGVSDIDDIHSLTGIVRLFLRELTEPLIPFDFFSKFCDSFKITDPVAKLDAFVGLIQDLPAENYQTMKELFRHLEKVMENSDENKMTSHNLAIVFGPTLMWLPINKEQNYSATVILQGQIVEYLLQEHLSLFKCLPV